MNHLLLRLRLLLFITLTFPKIAPKKLSASITINNVPLAPSPNPFSGRGSSKEITNTENTKAMPEISPHTIGLCGQDLEHTNPHVIDAMQIADIAIAFINPVGSLKLYPIPTP